jgi:NAD(P)H-flavin reductase
VERSVKYKVAGLEARWRYRIARAQGIHRAIPPLLAYRFSILLKSPAMPVQTFTAQVDSIENLTDDVRRLDLRLIEPKTITFKPGQFISFEMLDPQTGRLLTRAYSIASQPNQSGVITLLFNLVSGGPGSGFLFHLKAGEKTQTR